MSMCGVFLAAVVLLEPGVRELKKAWDVTPAESGTVFRSADPTRPAVLSAARRITGFQAGTDGVWRVTIEDVRNGKWNFTQLFVNGERRKRPSIPAEGFFFTTGNAYPTEKSYGGFTFRTCDLTGGYANLADIEVETFYNWSVSKMRLAEIDAKAGVLRFTNDRKLSKVHSDHSRPRRFRLENVKEAFGRPGEWYLDRPTGVLSYCPKGEETPETCVIEAPCADRVLRVLGEPGKPVENVRFENVVFRYSNVIVPDTGTYAVQGELNVPAAVELVGAKNVVFDRCTFERTGGWGAACGPETRDCAFVSCLFWDLGAGGVRFGAPYQGYSTVPAQPENAHELTSGIRVENCLIVDGGKVYHAGIGVLAARTWGAKILHNEIAHFDYTAISVGWDWSGKQVLAHDNEVAFNHAYDIGRKVLSDMGILYTLGDQPGTTLHDNVFHDIDVYEYGGKGIYLDECTSHVDIYNNLVYDTLISHSQSFTVGNRLYNNIFVDARDEQLLWRSKVKGGDLALDSRNNIVVWRTGRLFTKAGDFTATKEERDEAERLHPNPASGSKGVGNLYFKMPGRPGDPIDGKIFTSSPKMEPVTLAEWQTLTGSEAGSVNADPQFVDYAHRDFRLKPTSPALKLGFKPFDYSRAGLSDPQRVPRAGMWGDPCEHGTNQMFGAVVVDAEKQE